MGLMQGRQHIWRISNQTFQRYDELMEQIRLVNDETSDAHWALVEDVRGLPGFPKDLQWEIDDVIIDVIETPTSIITLH